MVKVTDYIVQYLEKIGIKHAFMVTGGGAMHLNDSFAKSKTIKTIFSHHEQASSMGAEGYSRVSGQLAVINVTTGPGGLNTLSGVLGQWTDSIPVLYISGQVKYETTIRSCPEINLRQLGDQEVNIIDIVKPITKYTNTLDKAQDVKKILEEAIYHATNGRKGPVWIDIPLNVQGAFIDESNLSGFIIPNEDTSNQIKNEINLVYDRIKDAKRPVIIAGHGIRLSNSQKEFKKLLSKLKIPVLTTFNGFDLIESDNNLFIGRIGTLGNRAGNFALQNSDLVISIGSRNNIRQVSYNWNDFARNAFKISVDIDKNELDKNTFVADLKINSDAKKFINLLFDKIANSAISKDNWLDWCIKRKEKYPVVLESYIKSEKVNPYFFIEKLTQYLKPKSVIVAGNGTACVSLFQAGIVKKDQRIFWNSGCASMGYDLPAAIGACYANNEKEVICIAGDGSFQMNIQELITVTYNKLPIKIFYFNNNGYISIRQTQTNFFEGRIFGSDPKSGLGLPNIIKVAEAYGFHTVSIHSTQEITNRIEDVMKIKGAVLCEVILDENYVFSPKVSSKKLPDGRMVSAPLEDMSPFLERDEFLSNMINN
jgi:acetolactate synthase I/II/III large subunit